MYCQSCGSLLPQDARFCSSCGRQQLAFPKITPPPAQVGAPPPRHKQSGSKVLLLVVGCIILFAVIAGVIDKPTPDSSNSMAQQSSTAASPQTARPNIPPPEFHIYKSKLDQPTAVVVPPNTTDEQLKSLLWFFREKVRSHQFKDIGLTQPTAKQWGNKGYLSGMLVVYRGEKCANEGYVDANSPCGYGEHDDAVYQWGIDADPNKDSGSIRVNGNDTLVFDYSDGWQVSPAVQARLEAQIKFEQAQRDLFAEQLQQKLTSMGYEITVWVHGEGNDRGRELNLDSQMFKDTATRVQFINGVLPEWRKDLCKAGFREVRLRQGGSFELGQAYSLGCENL